MEDMEIELVRGTRRRKHVEAVLVGDRLRVSFPRWMSLDEAQVTAQELAERMRRRTDSSAIDVAARARRLAREYGLPRPRTRALGRQHAPALGLVHARGRRRSGSRRGSRRTRPGSSTTCSSTSSRTCVVPSHGPAHDALVDRFPYAERARGFLIAVDLDPDDGDDVPPLLAGDVRP